MLRTMMESARRRRAHRPARGAEIVLAPVEVAMPGTDKWVPGADHRQSDRRTLDAEPRATSGLSGGSKIGEPPTHTVTVYRSFPRCRRSARPPRRRRLNWRTAPETGSGQAARYSPTVVAQTRAVGTREAALRTASMERFGQRTHPSWRDRMRVRCVTRTRRGVPLQCPNGPSRGSMRLDLIADRARLTRGAHPPCEAAARLKLETGRVADPADEARPVAMRLVDRHTNGAHVRHALDVIDTVDGFLTELDSQRSQTVEREHCLIDRPRAVGIEPEPRIRAERLADSGDPPLIVAEADLHLHDTEPEPGRPRGARRGIRAGPGSDRRVDRDCAESARGPTRSANGDAGAGFR